MIVQNHVRQCYHYSLFSMRKFVFVSSNLCSKRTGSLRILIQNIRKIYPYSRIELFCNNSLLYHRLVSIMKEQEHCRICLKCTNLRLKSEQSALIILRYSPLRSNKHSSITKREVNGSWGIHPSRHRFSLYIRLAYLCNESLQGTNKTSRVAGVL